MNEKSNQASKPSPSAVPQRPPTDYPSRETVRTALQQSLDRRW